MATYNPDSTPLTHASVLAAHDLIKPYIRQTPIRTSTTLSDIATANVSSPPSSSSAASTPSPTPRITLYLKLEPLQKTGSFKLRGATHSVLRLPSSVTHVATHSSGNHAAALALAAQRRGLKASIVMPSISTPSKISATRKYGGEVVFSGSSAPERQEVLDRVVERTGATVVLPYDSNDTIVGQGTVGVEAIRQVEEAVEAELGGEGKQGAESSGEEPDEKKKKKSHLDAIITPVGGGGLLAGCCLAAASTPNVAVFAAEPAGADDCYRAFNTPGRSRIPEVAAHTIADGLRTPVGVRNWEIIKSHVKGVFRAEEDEILEAMKLVWERCKVIIEPSSAVPVAVVLWNKEWAEMVRREYAGREEVRVAVVISGGNTTIEKVVELWREKEEREKGGKVA